METPAPKPNTATRILSMAPTQQAELYACASERVDTPAFRIEPTGYIRARGRGGKGIGYADEVAEFCRVLAVQPKLPDAQQTVIPTVEGVDVDKPDGDSARMVPNSQPHPPCPNDSHPRQRRWIVRWLLLVLASLAIFAASFSWERVGRSGESPGAHPSTRERRERPEQGDISRPSQNLPKSGGVESAHVASSQWEQREHEEHRGPNSPPDRGYQSDQVAVRPAKPVIGAPLISVIANHLVFGERLPAGFLAADSVGEEDLTSINGPLRQVFEQLNVQLHLSRDYGDRQLSEQLIGLSTSKAIVQIRERRMVIEIPSSAPGTALDLLTYLARNIPAVTSEGVRIETSTSRTGKPTFEGPVLRFSSSNLVGLAYSTKDELILKLMTR